MKAQMMQFRVNDEEKVLLVKCAKKAGMTVSEYIRACMLMGMVVVWGLPSFEDHRPYDRHEGNGSSEACDPDRLCAR